MKLVQKRKKFLLIKLKKKHKIEFCFSTNFTKLYEFYQESIKTKKSQIRNQ